MVAGLLGNESSDSNRFTLVTPKSENDVRLQATLGNQNPTGLPVGVVSNTAEIHTMEHLGATFLRNHKEWAEKVIYFGPMGCRTGFYMILAGDLESKDVVDLVTEMFTFMAEFEGDVPGAAARDCGNYLDMNLPLTKIVAKRFLDNTLKNITEEHLVYPD